MANLIAEILKFIREHKNLIYLVIIAGLIAGLCATCSSLNNANKKYETAKSNEKALMTELQGNQSQVREMQMSIETLQLFGDSVSQKLLDAQKSLKVKDKNIQNLQYMLANFKKTDTLILTQYDTIFKDPEFVLDTMIGDSIWLNVHLFMQYPNLVCTEVNARSEKEVVISSKRETIDPPCKFFLFRWFQKKHTVTTVDVNEENPYITSQQNRFIKISD